MAMWSPRAAGDRLDPAVDAVVVATFLDDQFDDGPSADRPGRVAAVCRTFTDVIASDGAAPAGCGTVDRGVRAGVAAYRRWGLGGLAGVHRTALAVVSGRLHRGGPRPCAPPYRHEFGCDRATTIAETQGLIRGWCEKFVAPESTAPGHLSARDIEVVLARLRHSAERLVRTKVLTPPYLTP